MERQQNQIRILVILCDITIYFQLLCNTFYSSYVYFSIHYNKFNTEMKFNVEIDVMPLKALLDPQGKAVTSSMQNIGLGVISNVRIGKHITLEIEAANEKEAEEKVEKACKELLHNPIMESYTFVIKQA